MKKTLTGLAGTTLAGAAVLIALHGKAFLDALGGLPVLLSKWTDASMLGAWTIVAGMFIGSGMVLAFDRWIPAFPNPHWRKVLIDLFGGGTAVWVVFMLMPGLPGLIIGLLCFLFSPLLARAFAALGSYIIGQTGMDP